MNTPTNPNPDHPLPPELPVRQFARLLEAILIPLRMLVFSRMHLIGPGAAAFLTRFDRVRRRLTRLFDRIAAGKPAPKPRAPLPGPRKPSAAPYIKLPAKKCWLLDVLVNKAGLYTHSCEILLETPESQQLLAANPAIMRSLRPILRLLGVQLPPALQPPPRKPRPKPVRIPKPPRAKPFSLYPHPPRSPWGISRSIIIPRPSRKLRAS